MYFIRFNTYEESGKVLVRNKRKNETFNHYRDYIANAVLNKMAKKLVESEEQEELTNYTGTNRRRKLNSYKEQYEDMAYLIANEELEKHYPGFSQLEEVENYELNDEVNNLAEEMAEEEQTKKSKDKKKFSIKSIFTKFGRKNKKETSSICDQMVETVSYDDEKEDTNSNYDEIIDELMSQDEVINEEETSSSIYDQIVENVKFEDENTNEEETSSSIYDDIVENVTFEDSKEVTPSKEIPKVKYDSTPIRKIPKKEVLTMNVFSKDLKDEVLEEKINRTYNSVLRMPCVLTRNGASCFAIKKAFKVNLEKVEFPPRQIDCGCGIIEIYGDEFQMLIESKYNVLKENEEVFNKLPKAQRESFDAYYKKEVKNAFDYSNKGKVKLTKTEYNRLLEIHESYCKILTIRREREELLNRKNKYIEKVVQQAMKEAESKFEKGEQNLAKAEAKYMASLENVKPVKVIKK